MKSIKNAQLREILEGLKEIKKVTDYKFNMTIIRNKKVIETEIKLQDELIEQSDEYKEFDQERANLAKKYAEKDEKGNPKFTFEGGRQGFDIKDWGAFTAEVQSLIDGKYKKTIEEYQKQLMEYEKMMNDNATVDIWSLSETSIEKLSLPLETLEKIYPIIEFENQEEVKLTVVKNDKPAKRKK